MTDACKWLAAGALALLLGCTPPPDTAAFKAEFAKGTAAYDAGDYQTARKHWAPLAAHYDLAALRNMGHLYRQGLGVARDPEKARRFYEKAARKGFAPAQFNLGLMYVDADGIAADRAKGMAWLQKAANAGYQPAAVHIRLLSQRAVPFGG